MEDEDTDTCCCDFVVIVLLFKVVVVVATGDGREEMVVKHVDAAEVLFVVIKLMPLGVDT